MQLRNAVALDADIAEQIIFWADLDQKAIFRYLNYWILDEHKLVFIEQPDGIFGMNQALVNV